MAIVGVGNLVITDSIRNKYAILKGNLLKVYLNWNSRYFASFNQVMISNTLLEVYKKSCSVMRESCSKLLFTYLILITLNICVIAWIGELGNSRFGWVAENIIFCHSKLNELNAIKIESSVKSQGLSYKLLIFSFLQMKFIEILIFSFCSHCYFYNMSCI